MRQIEGEAATREWLEGIVDAGIEPYPDEYAVSQVVADGELDAGFANHYYIQRVLDGSPNALIQTAFTSGDAGSIFDVAGAAVIDESDRSEMAENFIRHLLSAEAVWPPERSVCRLVTLCGSEGTNLPDDPDAHPSWVGFETELEPAA